MDIIKNTYDVILRGLTIRLNKLYLEIDSKKGQVWSESVLNLNNQNLL